MKSPSAPRRAIGGGAASALALLLAVCAAPAWAQRVQTPPAGQARVKPPLPPPPKSVRTATAPPPLARPVQPVKPVPVLPIRFASPPIHAVNPIVVKPLAARPVGMPNAMPFGSKRPGVVRPVQPVGIAPATIPPRSKRLLFAPPAVPKLAAKPLPAAFSVSQPPRVNGIPPLPPGAKLYCSPWSVMYNTGSICFNPDIETINPDFYPWGLFSPPPFVNAPGFVAPIPPGLLIRYCPKCAEESAGLLPGPTPLDRWRQTTAGRIAGLAPQPRFAISTKSAPPVKPSSAVVQPEGPPVVLVLTSGMRELVSRYWLGQDWLLHFITVNGSRQAIPLGRLNLKATGAANYERGVTFVIPAWPDPQSNH